MRLRRSLVVLALALGGVLAGLLVLAMVIHFVLLSTDQFNWLEPPRGQSESRLVSGGN